MSCIKDVKLLQLLANLDGAEGRKKKFFLTGILRENLRSKSKTLCIVL